MVVSLNIKDDIKRATRLLNNIEKRQLPFAIAKALTLSAKDAQAEITRTISRVFDRPTKMTVNSVRVETATKKKLSAAVLIKDEFFTGVPVAKWLRPQTKGGPRKHKRFERALISAGVMPSSMYAVPSKRLRLNRFGNVPKGMHTRILSQVKAGIYPTQYRASGTKAEFFALPKGRGKLPAGIWQRKGSGRKSWITLIFAFVSAPRYRKRLPFDRIARKVATKRFPFHFRRTLRQALRTARGKW